MCRVRLGLTDVHFEEWEPNFPRRAYYRPLVAAFPIAGERRLGPLIPIFVDEKPDAGKKAVVVPAPPPPPPPKSESPCLLDQHIKNKEKRRKRKDSANETSSKGSSSSSQSSTASSSSGDGSHNSRSAKPTKKNNPASAFAKGATNPHPAVSLLYKHSQKKLSTAVSSETSRKGPPAKRVRFAMDMKNTAPRSFPLYAASDSSDTHSSQESMIDPGPLPPRPVGGWGPRLARPAAGLSTGPSTGPTVGRTAGPTTGPKAEPAIRPPQAQSTRSSKEPLIALSHKSSNASLSETPDVYSGYYRALDAPRPYKKKKVPGPSSSAKSQSDHVSALKSAQIIRSGKPCQQQNTQNNGNGTGGSALSSESEKEEGTEEETEEETESETESETEDGVETDNDDGAHLVTETRPKQNNSTLSTRPNGESRFAKLRPTKKLPKSILKASSKFFGTKEKEREEAKPKVARSPSVSATDEEDESD